jgi:hypothetical protein
MAIHVQWNAVVDILANNCVCASFASTIALSAVALLLLSLPLPHIDDEDDNAVDCLWPYLFAKPR